MSQQNESRISVLLMPDLKKELDDYCEFTDTTVSQLVRKLIKTHLANSKPLEIDDLDFSDEV